MHAELDELKEASRVTADKGSVLADVTALDQQLAALRSQLDALRAKHFMKTKHWLLAPWVLIVFTMALLWWLQLYANALVARLGQPLVPIIAELGSFFVRPPMNVTSFGYMPAMFMCFGSALWMVLVSLLTPAPSRATIEKVFPSSQPAMLKSA